MAQKIIKIVGRIVNRTNGDGVAGLRVEVWDKDLIFNDLVGSAVTDSQGAFQIEFDESYFRESFLDRQPDLFFKVYRDDELIRSTEDSVLWNVEAVATEFIIEVGLSQEQPQEVRGALRLADGSPADGLLVSAFDRDLRSEELLGQCQTDAKGLYRIRYAARQTGRREKGSADLVLKATAADGSLLATSQVLFNAPSLAEVDLTIPAERLQPPPLFEKIARVLAPLLEDLKVEELEEDQEHQDLSFLSGETGFAKNVLARFVMAHKLRQDSLPAEFWFALLGGSFFQFNENRSLQEQLAATVDSLPALDAAAVRKSLISAFNQREIAEALRERNDDWIGEFLQFVARRLVGQSDEPTFVQLALEDAGIKDPQEQETFARLFVEHKKVTPTLLNALNNDRLLGTEAVANLHTSLLLTELTEGDFSVVQMLKEEFGIRRPEEIRTLAKKSRDEWVSLLKERHAAGDIKLPVEVGDAASSSELPVAEVYGDMLERRFREAYPTTAFVGGLERALQSDGPQGLRQAETLSRFLAQHENFELLNTPVDDFLRTALHPDFQPLAGDEDFRQELQAVQRVFKLAPTFEATDTLLGDGLHSAQQVYRVGETEFVRRYAGRDGFTVESARRAWNRAADTHAAVLTIIADLKALDREALPRALTTDSEALSSFPNLNNLFRTGDLCQCEHCRSVLSPSAYFTDLLMFLKDRKAADPSHTVKDILFNDNRRPDLGYLELNCDNALTPLPYVDVVCEVLEDAVDGTGENELELKDFTAVPSDALAAKAAVAQALKDALTSSLNDGKEKIALGNNFSLSQVTPSNPNRWVVHGDDVTYLLKKKPPSANFFAKILPNIKASAAELRAYPQYVNPKAYEKLRQARYPLALPFDLFAEEVRTALQKTNLQRWDLMRTLRGAAAPNKPTDGEIAAEYFSISSNNAAPFDEKRLILVADVTEAGQQAVWGETGNTAWLNTVGIVKNFLQKTSLEYDELLALLDLKFINPTSDIAVHPIKATDPSKQPAINASCDTDKKVIQILDAEKLDRLHRFLRLWRKLKGWKMWELDLVIRHPRIGNGVLNEQFLINLFHFNETKNKLGGKVTVEQALALFGNLNAETRFTKLYEKREDGLYQRLFLNRQLTSPLDLAFEVTKVNVAGPTVEKLSGHYPIVLAALGLREADIVTLKGLTKSSDGTPYITDDLTLANLSFLWRHALLSRILKFKAEDWKTLLKVLGEDVLFFANPKAALDFLEKVDYLKAADFTPDELNWLLAADRSANAAIKETDAARFLSALRKDLQAVQAENDPSQYDFLNATPPTDIERLTPLLTSLLQKLGRDEASTQFFIETLRDEASLEKTVEGLPLGFDFPATITGAPNNIPIRYEPALSFGGAMTDAQRIILLNDPSLAAVTGLATYKQAIKALFEQPGRPVLTALPAGFNFPAAITGAPNNIPIRYEPKLRFAGLMTATERSTLLNDLSLASVTGIAAYQRAIEEFFNSPRMALKFFEPVFTASLPVLPAGVDFKTLADPVLARNISYDAEQRLLRYAGILSQADKAALDLLSADANYRNAVNSLFTQPSTTGAGSSNIWLQDTDLLFPLRDLVNPAQDNLAKNLATATKKALLYLSRVLSENTLIQQVGTQLGLTSALARLLLTGYAVMPQTLMSFLTGTFAATTSVVDYATLKSTFDGWFWANRVSALWKKWKLTLAELEKIGGLAAGAQLLNFQNLPLVAAGANVPLKEFLRTSLLFKIREGLPETDITLLEVLEKLNGGAYPSVNDFAADVERLNAAWSATNVSQLVLALDIVYPGGYRLAESWERLRRAFYFLDNLNAGADTVKAFAAAALSEQHVATLKVLLRSRFGAETWLTLSAEIQDGLRERKRDALAAYLLTRPKPTDAPTGKWENTNDLYAYYLLDVEMSACQLTSRLVQASGSVQLFVQRCFMGLEPGVKVNADGPTGDSAWRWWQWMSKYRVWEANRKVFLWPENWIEPELKKDRSQFFKNLENELLQNDINQDSAETAFLNYLEKLDGVAQLEIAGFFQEDDGDNTIVHVFGRTTGMEPHLYYYRRYDFHQWTPWEKIELDIQGDYLIPAVVERRLFLFWPVFTEVPDEVENSKNIPIPKSTDTTAPVKKTSKLLKLQMAVSEYRQGKWTPKRVSKDADLSSQYDEEIVKNHYSFFPVDRSSADGRFGIKYIGYSAGGKSNLAWLYGAFGISGCKGVPEKTNLPGYFEHPMRPEVASTGYYTVFLKWEELVSRSDSPENDLTFANNSLKRDERLPPTPVLMQTPGIFKVSPAWHLSYMDTLWLDSLVERRLDNNDSYSVLTGTWLPFFYNDNKRTFFVLPSSEGSSARNYYPEIKRSFRSLDDEYRRQSVESLKGLDLSRLPPDERRRDEQALWQLFPEEPQPPYTHQQMKELMLRSAMRQFHGSLGERAFKLFQSRQFHFKNFYHPFVCDFASLVYNPLKGIPALMSRETQLTDSGFSFLRTYQPTPVVVGLPTEDFYPKEVVDFTPDGAYSSYNWELFFHAPLLIANALSRNQRFEEARDWYHFIFNPLGVESTMPGGTPMSKYWITKPFFETTDPQYVQQRIDNLLRMLAGDSSVPGFTGQLKTELEGQVRDWRTDPFEPHRIANYRTVAYQKTVVMKYLDNLIAWGDYLFRQDSMESINEATQLYILAAEILGPRPKQMPPPAQPPMESFNELEKGLDTFSNALVMLENLIPPLSGSGTSDAGDTAPLPLLYFCIPQNEKLLGYWDTVADRLYKLRHCMNIEGVVRQSALFEPTIDPGALVKAVAGGLDLSAALADLNAPLPLYRFNVLLQKANEMCNDVKALGSALLAVLEKKDAEALGGLRQNQELRMLEAVKALREQQIKEAKENLEAVKRSKVTAEARRDYYRNIERLSAQEKLHLDKLGEAHTLQEAAQGVKLAASIISILPAIDLGASGFGGTPLAKFKLGGLELGQAANLASDILSFLSMIAGNDAAMASSKAGFDRRWDDWKQQERLADKEIAQLDSQIAAAQLRLAIAEKELDNQSLQIENARAIDLFMRSKFTNDELYQWHIGEISRVYFQSYRLAYDLAKRAERCFRFELGLQDSSYIKFGYWDSLKKGLLAGEKLQHDLRRLDTAYLEQNRREFELTKHISLALLDPLALLKLRETGVCFFSLPEELFDLDYPGHYFRRLKSVSLTLPSVVGPYTVISCTLRLLKNSIRINTANGDNGYPRNTDDQGLPADDSRFVENNIPVKAIAASSAQNDSGVFELSFRDERYLPFEGAGAVSVWSLELFSDLPSNNPDPGKPDFGKPLRQFDYDSITDAIVHVKYTAREDAGRFKNGAVAHLRNYFSQDGATPSKRLFNLRHEFPGQWQRFLNPLNPANGNVFEFELSPSLFPFRDAGKTVQVNTIWVLARCTDQGAYTIVMTPPLPELPAGTNTMTLPASNQYGGLHFGQKDIAALEIKVAPTGPPIKWQIKMSRPGGGNLHEDPVTKTMEVEDVLLVLGYEWE